MNKKRTLICIVGELRSTELTFKHFKEKLLEPNNADLLLCIPDDKKNIYKKNPYYENAQYIKVFDSSKTITKYYEEISDNLKGNKDWKKLLYIKKFWLGGIQDKSISLLLREIKRVISHTKINKINKIKQIYSIIFNWVIKQKGPLDQPSGAGFVLLYRHFLLEMIKEQKLDEIYERFIITRSDYMYDAFHPPIDLLNPQYVWIPEGEDWRGYCDRHWVLSKHHLKPCLNLLQPIFCQTNTLFNLMKHKYDWNSESYIKLIFEMNNIQVKRFPRTQFLVRGSTQSPTWTKGIYNKTLDITIAYPSEYEDAKLNSKKFRNLENWYEYFKNNLIVSAIGSCRIFEPIHMTHTQTDHQYATWYTHYTKEIIQKIKIARKELIIPINFENLILQTGTLCNDKFHENFYSKSDFFIIEISSIKKFKYKDFYCNQWSIRDILKDNKYDNELYKIAEFTKNNMELQTKEEILEDLNTIYTLLNKKIIFVNHFNIPKDDGSFFEERLLIHNTLKEYCDNKNTFLFDPTEIINKYSLEETIIDSGHYTPDFKKIIGKELIKFAICFCTKDS